MGSELTKTGELIAAARHRSKYPGPAEAQADLLWTLAAALSAQEEELGRMRTALEQCVTIVDHAVEHYKGCVAVKMKREITVHARAALEGSER